MAEERNVRGPADHARVNVNEQHELDYWTKKWGCSERELKRAVKTTASEMADTLEEYLKSNGQKRN
jgi:hypothetical protein